MRCCPVSGVGEFKFEKYGEQFLQCIARFNRENSKTDEPDSLGAVDFPAWIMMWCRIMKGRRSWMRMREKRNCRPVRKAGKKTKEEFVMTEEIAIRRYTMPRGCP